ncbi:hypothetical protein CRYUN_Cryun31cG0054000 [Craigia yunnanensis]
MTDTDRERHRDRETGKQKRLPACKPVLTPAWVITIFLFTGFIFIPVGLVTLRSSRSVVEIVEQNDTECVPEPFRIDKFSYIQDDSIPKNFSFFLKTPWIVLKILIHCGMLVPFLFIFVYFASITSLQVHRYVKSRSDLQLLHGQKYHDTSSCHPVEFNNYRPIVPCRLIAWSFLMIHLHLFVREQNSRSTGRTLPGRVTGITCLERMYILSIYKNGTLIGGGKLNPRIPLSDQEDLIVWMLSSALPSFRKMYGRIEEDLDADDVVVVQLMNNYNTYSFGGKKKLVLSTSSWLGGKNDSLGLACLCWFFFSFPCHCLHAATSKISKVKVQETLWGHDLFTLEQEKPFRVIQGMRSILHLNFETSE